MSKNIKIDIPVSCIMCRYGVDRDLSVDDISALCLITGREEDLCDFRLREDNTLRQSCCPLPYISEAQYKLAEERIRVRKLTYKLFYKYLHAKKKSVKLRSLSRLKKIKFP